MVKAKGSKTEFGYVPEVTFGTTPVSPSLIELPLNSANFKKNITTIETAENLANRQKQEVRHGVYHTEGSFECDFGATDYDDFLESAFMSAISTGVLKIGSTMKHFSIEERLTDLTRYRLYKGMTVNTFNLSANTNDIVKANFSFFGKELVLAGSSVDATMTAKSGNDKMTALTGTISEGGSTIAVVTAFDLTLDNGLNPTHVIGSQTTPELEYGRAQVSGSLTAYFEDESLMTKFVGETETSIALAITDGTNTYTFLVPRALYTDHTLDLNTEQSRMQTLQFTGLYDSTEATTLKLTIS